MGAYYKDTLLIAFDIMILYYIEKWIESTTPDLYFLLFSWRSKERREVHLPKMVLREANTATISG